jgi:hypothetical protein
MKYIILCGVVFIYACTNSNNELHNDNISVVLNFQESPSEQQNNPVIFFGSSFGEFIQILHKTGNYNKMLEYTSIETRKQFGDSMLIDYYQRVNFSYPLKLKAYKNNNLYYQTTINATHRTIQIPVVIENDTCRIYLEKLDLEKPFLGM